MGKQTLTYTLVIVLVLSLLTACGNSPLKNNLTNNPSIDSVKEAITGIESITSIDIVTEDNDPNGQLGKQGGYTSCLYFKSSLVTDETDESTIEAGTSGGGSIEVYANKSDAEKRNKYLEAFDGTALSSGSHKVLGTLVIRISDKLNASQQKRLETDIMNALASDGGNKTVSEMPKTDDPTPKTDNPTPKTDNPTPAILQLDKKEIRGRIGYRIESSWNKIVNNSDSSWRYLPYESEEDGYFSLQVITYDDFIGVDTESLNKLLDNLEEETKPDPMYIDCNYLARTDIKGIPVMRYESKLDDSGCIYKEYGFNFIYGDSLYGLSVRFPEDGDSQFFSSTLTRIVDSIVINEYTQSELPSSDEGNIGDFHVKILDGGLTKDYNGKKAVVVNFKFTNNSASAADFLFSTDVTAYQDGVELDIAIIMDQSLYDAGLAQKKIKPGVSLVVQSAFVLSSDSPVVIEVTKPISFGKTAVLKKTFNVK